MCFKILGTRGGTRSCVQPPVQRQGHNTDSPGHGSWDRAILSCHLLALPFISGFSRTLVVCTQDNTFPGGLCHPEFPRVCAGELPKSVKLGWLAVDLAKSRKVINSQWGLHETLELVLTQSSQTDSSWAMDSPQADLVWSSNVKYFWANIQIGKFDLKIRFLM